MTAAPETIEGLPDGWQIASLGELTNMIMGQSPPSSTYNESGKGMPFLQGKAEFQSRHPKHTKWTIAPLKIAPQHSILISVRAPVGDVNNADIEYCIGRGLASISLKEGTNDFLYHLLTYSKSDIEKEGSGSIFKSINKQNLAGIKVACPPLLEQKKIASVLSALKEAKEKTADVLSALKELKKSMMKYLFTYGAVPIEEIGRVSLKETEIGLMPEHWNIQPLGKIADLASGGTPSKANPSFWIGSIPWASPKDIKKTYLFDTEDHISESGLREGSRLVPENTILIVVRGMILMRDVPITLIKVPMALNQDMKAAIPHEGVNPEYLLYALNAHKQFLFREIGTSAHGTRRLSTSAIVEWLVPVPPTSIQKQIADSLYSVDKKIEAEENKKNSLDALFNTLLFLLMKGKMRVNHLET